jgi:hypothetical protein
MQLRAGAGRRDTDAVRAPDHRRPRAVHARDDGGHAPSRARDHVRVPRDRRRALAHARPCALGHVRGTASVGQDKQGSASPSPRIHPSPLTGDRRPDLHVCARGRAALPREQPQPGRVRGRRAGGAASACGRRRRRDGRAVVGQRERVRAPLQRRRRRAAGRARRRLLRRARAEPVRAPQGNRGPGHPAGACGARSTAGAGC